MSVFAPPEKEKMQLSNRGRMKKEGVSKQMMTEQSVDWCYSFIALYHGGVLEGCLLMLCVALYLAREGRYDSSLAAALSHSGESAVDIFVATTMMMYLFGGMCVGCTAYASGDPRCSKVAKI